jgi:predicted dehydrogenase
MSVVSPVGVAIIGCGNIAGPYVKDIITQPALSLRGVTDMDSAKAAAFAAEHNTHHYPTLADMLADPSVEIVVNLTIHHAHKEVTTALLEGGKHVFSEKPMALSYADAAGLVELAARKGLRLASAPTTLMGEAQQTAWRIIREGGLGTVRVAYAEVNWGRIESWHPNPGPFYDVGPMQDVGVYPLTILASIFGPVRKVTATATTLYPHRVTKEGVPFSLRTPDFVIAILEHEGGEITRLTTDFYVSNQTTRQTGLEFHGDTGSLYLESWHAFNSPLMMATFGEAYTPIPFDTPTEDYIHWARALNDMAISLRENRPHRFGGDLAAHICEILEAVKHAYEGGQPVAVKSSFGVQEPVK